VTDFRALERAGISRSATAEILMRAYLRQVLEAGFFHADPHPGNLFVRPGPVVVLVDFGMVGDITPAMRDNIRRVFLGIVRRDFDDVIFALIRLGFIAPDADLSAIKRALVWTVDSFYQMSFGELQAVDPQLVLDHLQDVLYTESFHIPSNFAFLGRALGTLSGLCTALDPSFQFVTVAEPYARALVREGAVRRTVGQALHETRRLAETAWQLPRLSRDVLGMIDNGEFSFRYQLNEVVRSVDRLERAARRILYGLLVTGFLVAGAFVFRKNYEIFAEGAFIFSLIFLIGVFYPFRRRK
jgi:predicted unusual protein kinase regulating ubiquinone biosynthesis (AarF/ABC1/UbiB family)